MKYVIMTLILLVICVVASAASWDIGAVQLEGGATDIGAVQESAAAPGGGQVIIIQMSMIPLFLIPAVILIKRRQSGK